MRILISCLFLSLILLAGCSGNKPKVSANEEKLPIPYSLAPQNVYRIDAINEALKTADAVQKAESRRMFMTGLDLLINKNEAASSVEYFKEAIYFYPDEKNYQHLFKAYLKNKTLDLADSINTVLLERIDYTEHIFNAALIAAAQKNADLCLNFLRDCVAQGFAFKEKITEEKLFEFLKDNQSYQSLILTHFNDDEKMRQNLFAAFMKQIPYIDLPFEIISDSAKSFNFDRYINYDFALFVPGMEDSRFSRDVSNEYMYVGKFKCESGQALIYKSYSVIADTLNPVSVNLVVYDSNGTVKSNQEIACFCSALESKGFKIWQDMSFEVSTFKTNWEFDPLEKGYAGNKILSREKSAHNTYKIGSDNIIQETKVEAGVASSEK